ncbi:MAG TPA: hypothetical protein VNZ22_12365 [Bacillota bacterium]|nr:hypothetical protein [Bacillota bacterium]
MKRLLAWQLVWLVPGLFAASFYFGWLHAKAIRLSVSRAGGPDPEFSMWLPGFTDAALSMGSLSALIAGCVLTGSRQTRFTGLFVSLCALGYLEGCQARHAIFGSPRREAFTQLGARMLLLVQAIEAYHRDNGAYPAQLNALIPRYLDKLPSTGMGNYTNYHYYVGWAAQRHEGNPWILEIPAGYGMGFDQFYYFPLQNYPQGWPYERLGKWAYFHE